MADKRDAGDPVLRGANDFDMTRLQAALRRWGRLVLLATVAGAIASFAVSRALPPEYQSTAQLYLAPSSSSTGLPDALLGQNLARSYVQLATADVVLRPAMEKVGWGDDLRAFRDRLQVAQVRDTSVMTIAFTDSEPERAAAAANAVAFS